MKFTLKILSCFLLLLLQNGLAQNVTVTVQVLPPYSTYLPDYLNNPSRIYFTLLSNQNASVKLKVNITGDNGISLATSNNATSSAIQLTANQIKMMNGTDLKRYLDINNVAVTGINKNELYRGSGIPEGTYTLCIQVLDYTTGTPLSDPEPIGCSNPFEIQQVSPPQLIAPTCNESLDNRSPQNVVFTWLPPQGVPLNTVYKLKIVELIPSTRNPNEAMNSATTPAFFETTTNTYSFFYGPAQPLLKIGKKYAWRVTAMSANAATPGGAGRQESNFQNNGNSEVCSFVYGNTTTESMSLPAVYNINLIQPVKGAKINNGYGLTFSWTASNKPVKKYQLQFTDRVSQNEKITNWNNITDKIFTAKDAFYASKEVGLNLSETLPPSFTTSNGKIAWRIRALDQNNKAIDSSRVETYEIIDAPTSDRIKLIAPIQGKKITSGYGLKFEWESSKKKTITGYQVQFTDSYSQNQKITNWNTLDEKLFNGKNAFYASKDTQDLFVELPGQWTNGVGKIAWRVVGLQNKTVIDSSKIDTYELIEDTSELGKLNSFIIDNYVVQITNIYTKDPDKFSGSGKLFLWEGGKAVTFNFKDLKIKPVAYNFKLKLYSWAAIAGIIDIDINSSLYHQNTFDLETQYECDGTFQATLNKMKITANVEGAMDSQNNLFKVTKDLSHAEGMVVGKWITNWWIPVNGSYSNKTYEFESNETSIAMSFVDKFDGAVNLKNTRNVENLANGGIDVTFGGGVSDMLLKIKGLQGETDLSGTVNVSNAQPSGNSYNNFTILSIPFKNQKNLNFPVTFNTALQWKLNEDASVMAHLTQAYVHLSDNGALDHKFSKYPNGLNFDQFDIDVMMPQKSSGGPQKINKVAMSFANVYNKGNGYSTISKPKNTSKTNILISGYTAKFDQSDFLLVKNKLVYMNLKGSLYVPFINDWAGLWMNIDSKKIQDVGLDFDFQKKYFLSNNGDVYLTLSSGRLENNSIVISPAIHISNSKHVGLESNYLSMCDMYVDTTGAVSFNANFASNSESLCEGNKQWATYYQFNYGVDKMKIKQKPVKTDAEFSFSGEVILAPNISTTSSKETGFVYHGKAPDPGIDMSGLSPQQTQNGIQFPKGGIPKPKGPIASEDAALLIENSIEMTDDKKSIQGGYEDGAQKFGGGFKLVQNDPTWGNYFELGGSYEAKEPDCKQLESKLILGKKKTATENYSYWYFDFYQKNIVSIPIVPGIIEVNGFGGKAYYHMQVDYDSSGNVTNKLPNNAYSLGITAIADVRTAFDQGRMLHGKATLVTQFKGWSIDEIDYYVTGTAIAKNDSSNGYIQARMNGKLNWVDKCIDGNGSVWGSVEDIVCINEGAAAENTVGFYFGQDDFYIYAGNKEHPITVEVLCGNGWSVDSWLWFDKSKLAFGFSKHYDSGWKGLDLKVASAEGRLISDLYAGMNINYSPFQATGTAEFHGKAYGKGCVKIVGCIGGKCSADAALTVSMPHPVLIKGSVVCDVSRWIPNFRLYASWSSTSGFSISL